MRSVVLATGGGGGGSVVGGGWRDVRDDWRERTLGKGSSSGLEVEEPILRFLSGWMRFDVSCPGRFFSPLSEVLGLVV